MKHSDLIKLALPMAQVFGPFPLPSRDYSQYVISFHNCEILWNVKGSFDGLTDLEVMQQAMYLLEWSSKLVPKETNLERNIGVVSGYLAERPKLILDKIQPSLQFAAEWHEFSETPSVYDWNTIPFFAEQKDTEEFLSGPGLYYRCLFTWYTCKGIPVWVRNSSRVADNWNRHRFGIYGHTESDVARGKKLMLSGDDIEFGQVDENGILVTVNRKPNLEVK